MIITLKNSQTGKNIALILLGISLLSYSPFFLPLGNSFKKKIIQNDDNISDTTINKNRLLEKDYFLYKNGDESLTASGENYMLYDNQWLRVPSKDEYKNILDEVPLLLRYFVKPRRSTQAYDQVIQMEAGGDTILKSLKNSNYSNEDRSNVPSSPFLRGKSNAMLYMQGRMEAHDKVVDKVVESIRRQDKIRKKREEKRKQTLREWGLEE